LWVNGEESDGGGGSATVLVVAPLDPGEEGTLMLVLESESDGCGLSFLEGGAKKESRVLFDIFNLV